MADLLQIKPGVAIPLSEVELRTSRSGGPGGQHANVTASRVEAVFDVNASQALTEAQRARVAARLGPRAAPTAPDTPPPRRRRTPARSCAPASWRWSDWPPVWRTRWRCGARARKRGRPRPPRNGGW